MKVLLINGNRKTWGEFIYSTISVEFRNLATSSISNMGLIHFKPMLLLEMIFTWEVLWMCNRTIRNHELCGNSPYSVFLYPIDKCVDGAGFRVGFIENSDGIKVAVNNQPVMRDL